MKHYKLVEFLSNLNVKPPLHERKAPYWRLSGDGSELSALPVAALAIPAKSVVLTNHAKGTKHIVIVDSHVLFQTRTHLY